MKLRTVFSTALLAASFFPASAIAAVAPETCHGRMVLRLGDSHAVTGLALTDTASLQRRLPELEASMRAALAKDPTLGSVAADALLAAIRSGTGITQRSMERNEAIRWMAYQPQRGQYDVLSPVCLRLGRPYDAFEITVELPGAATAPQLEPECRIQATRDCTVPGKGIDVDLRGSSPNATVSLDISGQPMRDLGARGEVWTLDDPGPYDATLTVRAQVTGAPAPQARILHFLIPKVCGNLTYLGETADRSTATEPIRCERSVRIARCAPAVPPPAAVPLPVSVADRCEEGWVARGFLVGLFPSGSDLHRDIALASGPAQETFSLDPSYGLGASIERRFGPVVGLEAALVAASGDSEYRLTQGAATGTDTHGTNFLALTVGPNFHFLGCGGVDLYAGPFIGYGGYADPNYWVGDHHFAATFSQDFLWGAQLGLDVPLHDGPWAFHAGLRYLELDQDTDAGPISVDPVLVELGFAYQF